MFKCDCCGLCCMNLMGKLEYADLDRGDGICRFFCEETRLCTIYKKRPDKCNVDRMYEKQFKTMMSIQEYYELNYRACEYLKMQYRGQ